jgi:hypothetical protein
LNDSAAARFSAHLLRALREATLTVLAMVVAAAASAWLDPGPASAVLGAVLALSLSRSHLAAGRRGWLETVAILPMLSLATLGIGALLHQAPWVGATVFVAVVAAASWMRRFGPIAQRLGRLIALPMATILVVPPLPHGPRWGGSPAAALGLPMAVALLAMAGVLFAQQLGRLLGWLPPHGAPKVEASPAPAAASALKPSPPVRLALQMLVALAAAFAVGFLVFPTHWRWVVLTAFLVNIGSLGGFDVVRKSVLRVLGAAGGTLLAMAVAGRAGADPTTAGALILACIFVGAFLRVFGYGWWVLCVTLALALLQTFEPTAAPLLLWQRVLEIVIGAVIGVAAASFVFPIPSVDILRRRLANALAAMSEALDPEAPERLPEKVAGPMILVRQMRPVFRAHRVARHRAAVQPLDWIDALAACEAPVLALVASGETPGAVRKALSAARKALREPAEIGPALAALRELLARGSVPS